MIITTARAAPQPWARYQSHFCGAVDWLARSERRSGGSAAHYAPILGWSQAYPETTGYIIPTLLDASRRLGDEAIHAGAVRFGEWLLGIQNADGSWNGGTHPPRVARPSVFNTGQILKGMLALSRSTGEARWLDAGRRGASWLASGMGADGLWSGGDYRARGTPSYYTHVLWPMLAVAKECGDTTTSDLVVRGLRSIVGRRRPNGVIAGWSFSEGAAAFTHTIAYTIRGIQECALLLEDDGIFDSVSEALDHLVRRSELRGGALPGEFDEDWNATGAYVCLTGNAQVAFCVLLQEARTPDLRLVSAAARMVDFVCSKQRLRSAIAGIRGGVGGSYPLHGAYMRWRYPNWAAKYLCDAIMTLTDRLEKA